MVMDTPTDEPNAASATAFWVGTPIATSNSTDGVASSIGGGSHGGRRLASAHQIPLFLSLVSGLKQRARLVCHIIATVFLAFEGPTKPDEGYVDPPDCQEDRGNPRRLLFLLLFQPGIIGVLLDGRLAATDIAATGATATGAAADVLRILVVAVTTNAGWYCLGRGNPTPSNVSFEIPPIFPAAQKAIEIRMI